MLISVGGWNDGNDEGFERLAAAEGAARAFADNLDGADIDWEYPDEGESAGNYARLMRLLSSELRGRGKLMTAAVSAEDHTGGITEEVFE